MEGRTGFKPRITGAGTTPSVVAVDWAHFVPSADQTANLTAGNDVTFDTEKAGDGSIPITAAGVFTLKAGKSYSFDLGLGVSFSSAAGYFAATIHDNTNGVDIIARAYATPVTFAASYLRGPLGHSFGAYTVGATDIECTVRITLSSAITKLYTEASGTRLEIVEITSSTTSGVPEFHTDPVTADTTLDSTYFAVYCDTNATPLNIQLPAGTDKATFRIINVGTAGNDVTMLPSGTNLLTGVNAPRTLGDGGVVWLTYEPTYGWW